MNTSQKAKGRETGKQTVIQRHAGTKREGKERKRRREEETCNLSNKGSPEEDIPRDGHHHHDRERLMT
jgi:hypothetical protein